MSPWVYLFQSELQKSCMNTDEYVGASQEGIRLPKEVRSLHKTII